MAPQEYIKKLEKLEKEVAELRYRVNLMTPVEQIAFPAHQPTWSWSIPTCAICGLPLTSRHCDNPKCSSLTSTDWK
jgi:hypothetical protein